MSDDSKTSDPWLATVAAEATSAGIDRADQTIEPSRPGKGQALALLADLDGELPLEILDTLAVGGMGRIDRARQRVLGREVAVKSLRDDRADPALATELLREAWITGALEHPNIVPVHDIVTDDAGRPQVVMKRIAGDSWSDLLAARDPAARADLDQLRGGIEILLQVTNAVRFAHARRIVHRDLKPANVMIGAFGEVYVVDWGLAVSLDGDAGGGRFARASEEASRLAGTPAYMAPEMLGGEGAVLDERTDVYLLGAMLYEVMTGRPPHHAANLLEALEHVRGGEPDFPADLPAELVAIARRALARDRGDRHAGVAELADELRAFLDHLHSASLASEAGNSLARLRGLLESREPDRDQVHHLFGECRFGFRAALAAWPDNPEARRGLEAAVSMVVEHELARDDGGTALALLAEHPDPPPTLAARARRAAEARRDRERRLARLEADTDPRIGRWTRLVVVIAGSVLWTLFPLALALVDFESRLGPVAFLDWALVAVGSWTAILGGLWLWLRQAFGRTSINRVVFWGSFSGACTTFILVLSFPWIDAPIERLPVLAELLWATTAAVLAVAVDLRILVVAAAFLAAFAVGLVLPETRYWAMAAGNAMIALMAALTWGVDELKRR